MSNRKRINISVDPETYERVQGFTAQYKFENACELIVAFVHILIDRLEVADKRKYDLPEDEGDYIDSMFNDLSRHEKTPDQASPIVRHMNAFDKFGDSDKGNDIE